jgi:nucleoid DNA-binding protein
MKKGELYEKVATQTGLKRQDVKRTLDAAFAAMRASLSAGTDVALPGLGKIKVKERTKGEATEAGEDPKTVYRFRMSTEAEAKAEASE